MAPVQITEDYYRILEVDQKADQVLIVSSYKRLALKLHPDRNPRSDAKEAFQRLLAAYETLKDASSRREYDLIYPTIVRGKPSTQNSQSRATPASSSQGETPNEAAQIAALEKSKQERGARWRSKKSGFDSNIFELKRGIQRLEQEIKNLNSVFAAEAAAEARKNSWATLILSPLYKKPPEDSEEEKERKSRERQERRIQRDMKGRRLDSTKHDLEKEQHASAKARQEYDAAIMSDDRKIQEIKDKIRAREAHARQEKARAEQERQDKIWREQQEKLRKEQQAAEALRQKQAEAEEKRRQEEVRKMQEQYERFNNPQNLYSLFGSDASEGIHAAFPSRTQTSSCIHDGWWPKVQGRKPCPQCSEIWTYLLECPSCPIQACPRCQSELRPRRGRGARAFPRATPRVRTPSPNYGYNYWD